jgi:hypothetical protein
MAIQNLKKHLIAALLVFSIACFLAIHSHPKKKEAAVGASVSAAISPKVHCVSAPLWGWREREL